MEVERLTQQLAEGEAGKGAQEDGAPFGMPPPSFMGGGGGPPGGAPIGMPPGGGPPGGAPFGMP